MKIIAIGGCSGSGKSHLARALADCLGASVVPLDAYYHGELQANYDHPDALDWPLLLHHLRTLQRGTPVPQPVYLFDRHARSDETVEVAPAPFLVVEGIHALHRAELRALAALRVFVETPAVEALRRRLARDIAERGRTHESVLQQYRATVVPMAEQFVLPSRAHAHLTVSGEAPLEESTTLILSHLNGS
jgi:uridine kinase